MNGDGLTDLVGWTDPTTDEAFLFVDLTGDKVVNNGRELLGTGMLLPDGGTATNGFQALSIYDRLDHGGNGDGRITRDDAIWSKLRLWIDRNHDGICQRDEIENLDKEQITAIGLNYVEGWGPDGNFNDHRFRGTFTKSERGEDIILDMHDVFFVRQK